MKKFSITVAFFLLSMSMIIPVLPTVAAPTPAGPVIYKTASTAQIVTGIWDPIVTDGYNVLSLSYFPGTAEFLCSGYADYWGGTKGVVKEEEWWPMLATNWETEFRPDNETNSLLFNNTGGRKSILFTLRDNVKFTDGSEFNATVAKWNIDRAYIITGNLTGNSNGPYDNRAKGSFWNEIVQTKEFWTTSWNLSEWDAPDTQITPIWTPPDPTRYAHYYIGDPAIPANKIKNPNPYGGWDADALNFIHYSPYDANPIVEWVEIVTPGVPGIGGGQIRVHFAGFNSYGMEGMWLRQISYAAYHEDFTETGYYGYGAGGDKGGTPTPGTAANWDMIGTGPWIFESHNEILDVGYLNKNEDWWNNSINEAAGWGDVDRIEVLQFPPGDMGIAPVNIALFNHDIDYAGDSQFLPIDQTGLANEPNINYIQGYSSEYLTQITLNSINETWWSGGIMYPGTPWEFNFSWVDINTWYWKAGVSADPAANGIPRILRKALSYAFDYDTLIQTDLNDRVTRGGGILGQDNIFYNSSVPIAQYDLEYARELLINFTGPDTYSLTDVQYAANADMHNFSKQTALRGLTDPSDNPTNNAFWQNKADTTPLYLINFYYDDTHTDLKDKFELACNNLGIAIVQDADNKAPAGTLLWNHVIGTYWLGTFDGEHSIWSAQAWMMDYNIPMTIPEGWIHANYGDPSRGVWRAGLSPDTFPTWNFGFSYDDDIDYWISYMYQSEPLRKIEMLSKIADKEQNELYSMIWCYQGKTGECLWNEWETFFVEDRDDTPAGFWGSISAQFLRYNPKAEEFPLIPSAPLYITLSVSAASMIGIVFLLMRKKKLQ